jgi:hypothetical protein
MRRQLIIVVAAVSTIVPVSSALASGAHWCRQGDPPLYASAHTRCGLAGNIITDYVKVCPGSRRCRMTVQAPSSGKRYRIHCHRTGSGYIGTVYCEGQPGAGVWTRFPAEI